MQITSIFVNSFHQAGLKVNIFDVHSESYLIAKYNINKTNLAKQESADFSTIHLLVGSIPDDMHEFDVAWKIACQLRIFDLGILGYYIYSCPDLFTAIRKIEQFQHLVCSVPVYSFNKEWRLSLSLCVENSRYSRILLFIDIIYRYKIIICLVQNKNIIKNVNLGFFVNSKSNLEKIRSKFKCNITNDKLKPNYIEFNDLNSNISLPSKNEIIYKRLEILLIDSLKGDASQKKMYSQMVEQLMMSTLSDENFSCKFISDKLNISTRSLQRYLRRENTSFAELLSISRRKMAVAYINQGFSNKEIAHFLGYIEPNSFIRSFRRWFGHSPRKYKMNNEIIIKNPTETELMHH